MRKPDLAEGDFVRFLNDKLEGRIVRILPGERAVVEIEDGFPVETVFSELVKIAPAATHAPTVQQSDTGKKNLIPSSPFPLEPGIHLLLVPYSGQVHSGPWQVQLHNSGKIPVLFSIFFEMALSNSTGQEFGTLPPGGMLVLGDASSEHASAASCNISLLLHDQSLNDSRRFLTKRCTFSTPGIQSSFPGLESPYSFTTTDCIHRFAETVEPLTLDSEKARQLKEAMSGAGRTPVSPSQGASRNSKAELIVDLHIESITSGKVPPDDKQHLELQLKHFKQELDRAILECHAVVFFIHGVGNGILRKAIRSELDTLGLRYTDGPSSRFGHGATMVTL